MYTFSMYEIKPKFSHPDISVFLKLYTKTKFNTMHSYQIVKKYISTASKKITQFIIWANMLTASGQP